MRLSDLITRAAIAVGVHAGGKAEALKFASARLALASGFGADRINQALEGREALGSTGIGGGVALPHVCFSDLRRPYACLFTLAAPIEFDAIDKERVDLICALIAPSSSGCGKDEPLSYLAGVARIFRDRIKTSAMRKAKNPWTVYDIIAKSEETAGHLID